MYLYSLIDCTSSFRLELTQIERGTATGSPSSVHCSSSQTPGLLVFIISPDTPSSPGVHHLRPQTLALLFITSQTPGLPLFIISHTGSPSVNHLRHRFSKCSRRSLRHWTLGLVQAFITSDSTLESPGVLYHLRHQVTPTPVMFIISHQVS